MKLILSIIKDFDIINLTPIFLGKLVEISKNLPKKPTNYQLIS